MEDYDTRKSVSMELPVACSPLAEQLRQTGTRRHGFKVCIHPWDAIIHRVLDGIEGMIPVPPRPRPKKPVQVAPNGCIRPPIACMAMAVQRMMDTLAPGRPLAPELASSIQELVGVGARGPAVAPPGRKFGGFEGIKTPQGAMTVVFHESNDGAPDIQVSRHTFTVLAPSKRNKRLVQYVAFWYKGRLVFAAPIRFREWPFCATGDDEPPTKIVRFMIAAVTTMAGDWKGK